MASIRKIDGKNGISFKITVTNGIAADGRQIRHYKTYKPPKGLTIRQAEKQARAAAYEFERDIEYGFKNDSTATFKEYSEYVMKLRREEGVKAGTLAVNARSLERVNSYIGEVRIVDIRPFHINKVYAELKKPETRLKQYNAVPREGFREALKPSIRAFALSCGVPDYVLYNVVKGHGTTEENARKICNALGAKELTDYFIIEDKKPLSHSVIENTKNIIGIVLGQAEKEMIIKYNPLTRSNFPKRGECKKAISLQPEELKTYLNAADSEKARNRLIIYFLALTGCRRGEMMALRWRDIDFECKQVFISRSLNYLPPCDVYESTTKTGNQRYVPLSDALISVLLKWRVEQKKEFYSSNKEWSEENYIITNEKAEVMFPHSVNKIINEFTRKHKLPAIHPHTFRHSAASIMIANRIDVLTVSKILGHSSTKTTLDVYGHEIEAAKARALQGVTDTLLQKCGI